MTIGDHPIVYLLSEKLPCDQHVTKPEKRTFRESATEQEVFCGVTLQTENFN